MILRMRYQLYVISMVYLLTPNIVRLISAASVVSRVVSDEQGPGEILLRVFGHPFAPTSPQNVSPLCRAHSTMYLEALDHFTPWALNMFDSSTKIPSGIITGNIHQLGNYEQCVNLLASAHVPTGFATTRRHDQQHPVFRGQHCTASVQFKVDGFLSNATSNTSNSELDMKDLLLAVAEAAGMRNWTGPTSALYQWAFCVPSSCTAADVEAALGEQLRVLNRPGRVEVIVKVNSDQCLTSDENHRTWTAADLAIISVFAIFAFLLICSTVYDLSVHRKTLDKFNDHRLRDDVMVSFSLYTNGRNLLDTRCSKDTLTCMNGIRFLTICWVIFGHTYYMNAVTPEVNSADIQFLHLDWTKMVVMNGTVATDTFFLLSGLLLSYVFLKQMSRRPRFNIVKFYVHRYVRLTPPLAIAVFFYSTLFYHLGSGPLWDTWVGLNRDYCVEHWWSNLLYINNYIDLGRMCMGHTWYLSMDMQLFWLSPLIIYPLWRWPRVGIVIWGLAFSTSVIAPFAITYCRRLAGAMLYATDMQMVGNVFVYVYTRTYNRGGPYLIGMALGYILHITREKPVAMSKLLVLLGWLGSTLLCLVTLFGAYPMYQQEHGYNVLEASSFAAFYRSVWALGVAWVIFACVQGYGGVVNGFLSWKVFLPLSRVSYCAYLCHFIVLLYNAGSARTPQFLSTYNVVCEFLGATLITLFLATVVTLTFEVPFMVLDRALMSRERVLETAKQDDDPGSKTSLELSSHAKEVQDNIANCNVVSAACNVLPDKYEGHLHTLDRNAFDNVAFEVVSS